MNNFIKAITNTPSILAIVGIIGALLIQFGVKVDVEWLMTTAKLVCSLLVLIGVINNKGMETTKFNK